MLLQLSAIIIGFVLLALTADRFVFGASVLAEKLGVSPLLIGLTIVAFGTSAPEIFVAAAAALQGNTNLALGNAVGSNIANVGLVLGAAAIIAPSYLVINRSLLVKEIPFMFVAMGLCTIFFLNDYLSQLEALALLLGLAVFIGWTIHSARQERAIDSTQADGVDDDIDPEKISQFQKTSYLIAMVWLLLGLIGMALSSKLLVWGAQEIALGFGVSELVIGLTIVAIGTSLPEVAASVTSSLKGQTELAIGNVIGSNIFNILAVVGTAGVINPSAIEAGLLSRDTVVMIAMSVFLILLIKPFRGKVHRLTRLHGLYLLIAYLAYLGYLIYQNT